MPPRYWYWTILAGGLPTAFRAAEREDLLPTFNRIRDKHSDAEMKWFARGRLWDSPEAAQEDLQRVQARRDRDWRPGGAHRDPRQTFKNAKRGGNRGGQSARRDGKRSERPAGPRLTTDGKLPQRPAGPRLTTDGKRPQRPAGPRLTTDGKLPQRPAGPRLTTRIAAKRPSSERVWAPLTAEGKRPQRPAKPRLTADGKLSQRPAGPRLTTDGKRPQRPAGPASTTKDGATPASRNTFRREVKPRGPRPERRSEGRTDRRGEGPPRKRNR